MFKIISFFILLLLSLNCFGESVDRFSPGNYTFYGKLTYKKSPELSRLTLYSGTTRQYSIGVFFKDYNKAISYNNLFVEVSGIVKVQSRGTSTKVFDAKIIKSSTTTNAVSKGFTKH